MIHISVSHECDSCHVKKDAVALATEPTVHKLLYETFGREILMSIPTGWSFLQGAITWRVNDDRHGSLLCDLCSDRVRDTLWPDPAPPMAF